MKTISEETKAVIKALMHSFVLPLSLSFVSLYLGVFWFLFSVYIYSFVKKNTESSIWFFFFIKSAIALIVGFVVFYIFIVLAFSL